MRYVVVVLAFGVAVAAAEVKPPPDTSASSPNQDYRATVRTVVTGGQWTKHLRVERAGVVVYERRDPGAGPERVLISDDGRVVEMGPFRPLLIRDPQGDVVATRRLEEILLDEELGKSRFGRAWLDPRHAPGIVGSQLVLTTAWGDEVRFRLRDGAQLRDGNEVAIPSMRERFADLISKGHLGGQGYIAVHDPDGKTFCTIRATRAECTRARDVIDGPRTVSAHTIEQFTAAMATLAVFAPLVNPTARAPAPGWHLGFTFHDVKTTNYPFHFEALVPTLHTPPDLARALQTLRKLLPPSPP